MNTKNVRKYQATSMTQLAQAAGLDVRTFYGYFTTQDFHAMIDLGWNPHTQKKKLPPPIVKYIREKFIDIE
ncbi:TetR/AcrR family transcriptional regulator [Runella slithyformis]|uniref:TetR/AcrR family transcriptional regulator n=1 Tax=Runella slithyformis TaxID=106 RepID=UPI0002EE1483|nr:TetR family transcriptional regulator [Runella slithyformis]